MGTRRGDRGYHEALALAQGAPRAPEPAPLPVHGPGSRGRARSPLRRRRRRRSCGSSSAISPARRETKAPALLPARSGRIRTSGRGAFLARVEPRRPRESGEAHVQGRGSAPSLPRSRGSPRSGPLASAIRSSGSSPRTCAVPRHHRTRSAMTRAAVGAPIGVWQTGGSGWTCASCRAREAVSKVRSRSSARIRAEASMVERGRSFGAKAVLLAPWIGFAVSAALASGSMEGRLIDRAGAPVDDQEKVVITVAPVEDKSLPTHKTKVKKGRFFLGDLDPGEYRIDVTSEKLGLESARIVIRDAKDKEINRWESKIVKGAPLVRAWVGRQGVTKIDVDLTPVLAEFRWWTAGPHGDCGQGARGGRHGGGGETHRRASRREPRRSDRTHAQSLHSSAIRPNRRGRGRPRPGAPSQARPWRRAVSARRPVPEQRSAGPRARDPESVDGATRSPSARLRPIS